MDCKKKYQAKPHKTNPTTRLILWVLHTVKRIIKQVIRNINVYSPSNTVKIHKAKFYTYIQ